MFIPGQTDLAGYFVLFSKNMPLNNIGLQLKTMGTASALLCNETRSEEGYFGESTHITWVYKQKNPKNAQNARDEPDPTRLWLLIREKPYDDD